MLKIRALIAPDVGWRNSDGPESSLPAPYRAPPDVEASSPVAVISGRKKYQAAGHKPASKNVLNSLPAVAASHGISALSQWWQTVATVRSSRPRLHSQHSRLNKRSPLRAGRPVAGKWFGPGDINTSYRRHAEAG